MSLFLEYCFTAKNEVVILQSTFFNAYSEIVRYYGDFDDSSQPQYYPVNLVLDIVMNSTLFPIGITQSRVLCRLLF